MRKLTAAELLLKALGISKPCDIDLPAIAHEVGAIIKERKLDGCAARIVGTMEKAIISVDESQIPRRKRYSVAHELGHWRHHKGKAFSCRAEDIGSSEKFDPLDPERVADQYAADLLMPYFLFSKDLEAFDPSDAAAIVELGKHYNVSKMAAGIRLVDLSKRSIILVYHNSSGVIWAKSHGSVPWKARRNLKAPHHSQLNMTSRPVRSDSSEWFGEMEDDEVSICHRSIPYYEDQLLTLIHYED